jgi:PKHD-type hydroxylase
MATFYPIKPYTPPTEFYCCMYGAFSKEDVERIIDMAETQEFRQGTIGRGVVDTGVRNSNVVFMDLNQETEWLHDRVQSLFGRVAYDKFGLDLDAVEVLQYTKYDKDGHYSWHIDAHQGEVRPHQRKLSMTLVLTDPSEYIGGELMLNENGNQDNPTIVKTPEGDSLPLGTVVFFYSHLPHKVAPVIEGTRASLVAWAVGPKLR